MASLPVIVEVNPNVSAPDKDQFNTEYNDGELAAFKEVLRRINLNFLDIGPQLQ